jgi:uncharacterized protein (UPF0333 family)
MKRLIVRVRLTRLQACMGSLLLILSLFSGRTLIAQVLYGSISGSVQDASGASIPDASVTFTNTGTGQVIALKTQSDGHYLRPDFQQGTYDLTVVVSGFKPYTKKGILVTAGAVLREDVPMQIGGSDESVVVNAEEVTLQTDKADLHTELSAADLKDLPVGHYRSFQSLINLVPGATPGVIANSLQTSPERSQDTNVNGVNTNNNDTRIDGLQSVYLWLPDHAAYIPPAESIQTVNISTNNFDAESGMAGGIVTNVISKSGTNTFHGSAFAMNTNSAASARNFFNRSKQAFTNINIDGITIGGPIKKDKLFFFQSWEGTRERQGYTAVMTVPTADQRTGNFSAYAASPLYDPTTGASDGSGRTQFVTNGQANVIPTARLNATALKIQALIPLPNGPGTSNNYTNSASQSLTRDNFDSKVDYNVSSGTNLWTKYSLMRATTGCPPGLGDAGGVPLCAGNIGISDGVTQVADIGFTRVITPNITWDGTLGYIRLGVNVYGFGYGQSIPITQLGIPGTNGGNNSLINSGAPQFVITGYSQYGGDTDTRPYFYHQDTYALAQNVGWSHGKHYFRFGFEGMRHHMNFYQPDGGGGGGPQGQFDFVGGITGLKGGAATTQYNAYASFLLGLPQTVKETLQYVHYTTYDYEWAGYAQDRWQVTPALTMSLGVRYELYPMMTRSGRGGIEQYDPNTNLIALGGNGGNSKGLGISTSHKLFVPRIGLAYRLGAKTVLRAGYGISVDPIPLARPLRGFYPLTVSSTFTSANTYTAFNSLTAGIPAIAAPDQTLPSLVVPQTAQVRYIDGKEINRGYVESWNVVLERELPWHLFTTVAYVGTQTIHSLVDIDVNAGVPGGGTAGQPLYKPFGRTAITWAWNGRYNANYHGLQVSFERKATKGLTLKGAYTFSKAMNFTDMDGWAQLLFNTPSQIPFNHARAGYDVPNNLQVASTYILPFGRGQHYATSGLASALLGGWQVNGIFSAVSGRPFTVTASATSLNAPDNTQTADLVKPIVRYGTSGPGATLYDPSSFAAVTAVRFGTSGRNILRSARLVDLDAGLFRTFPIFERLSMTFRAEAFNLSNTPHFAAPNANVSAAGFLTTSSAAQDQRNLRFGLSANW